MNPAREIAEAIATTTRGVLLLDVLPGHERFLLPRLTSLATFPPTESRQGHGREYPNQPQPDEPAQDAHVHDVHRAHTGVHVALAGDLRGRQHQLGVVLRDRGCEIPTDHRAIGRGNLEKSECSARLSVKMRRDAQLYPAASETLLSIAARAALPSSRFNREQWQRQLCPSLDEELGGLRGVTPRAQS